MYQKIKKFIMPFLKKFSMFICKKIQFTLHKCTDPFLSSTIKTKDKK